MCGSHVWPPSEGPFEVVLREEHNRCEDNEAATQPEGGLKCPRHICQGTCNKYTPDQQQWRLHHASLGLSLDP